MQGAFQRLWLPLLMRLCICLASLRGPRCAPGPASYERQRQVVVLCRSYINSACLFSQPDSGAELVLGQVGAAPPTRWSRAWIRRCSLEEEEDEGAWLGASVTAGMEQEQRCSLRDRGWFCHGSVACPPHHRTSLSPLSLSMCLLLSQLLGRKNGFKGVTPELLLHGNAAPPAPGLAHM